MPAIVESLRGRNLVVLLVFAAGLVYWVLDAVLDLPDQVRRVRVGNAIDDTVDFLADNFPWFFDFIRTLLRNPIDTLDDALHYPPAIAIAIFAAAIAYWARGWQFAVLAFLGFLLIDAMAMWHRSMETLALVSIATVAAVIIGIPVGVLAARNNITSILVRPILDFMQTLPVFVYLLPAVAFFRIGVVPGAVATLIFAIPPAVRLTELGIRQVDQTTIEAAFAFGATPNQVLYQVQLPLALPTIMAGVNQVIMLALSMVVVAGMIGAGGLGGEVIRGITRLDMALGFEAGISVVILAIFLDRTTEAIGKKASRSLGIA
jgi:ABC-type proline/glycine betaine transport system permease subunit